MSKKRYVPEDSDLPGLAALFPEAGAPEFIVEPVRQLTGAVVDAAAANATYVRYRPHRRCVIEWAFPTEDGGKVFISGELQHRKRSKWRDVPGPHLYLEEERLLLQAFPHDAVLTGIETVVSPAYLRDVVAPAMGLAPNEAEMLTATLTRFKPWLRCVIVYEAQKEGRRVRAFGKLFHDDSGATLFQAQVALTEQLASYGPGWRVPAPLLYDPEVRFLLQADVGATLQELAREAREDDASLAQLIETVTAVGRDLPAFQRLNVEGVRVVPPDKLIHDLEEDIDSIATVNKDLAELLTAPLERMRAFAAATAPEPLRLTHNALRLSHIFQDETGLSLIDLDGLSLSGQSADAGCFLASLRKEAIRSRRTRVQLQCARAFREGWEASGVTDPLWCAFYAEMAFLKWAVRHFFSLDVDWPDQVDRLLAIGERMLSEARAEVGA